MTTNGNHIKLEELFKKSKVKLGDSVIVETSSATHVGILIPRYEYADSNHLVLKLKSGYNIGINLGKIKSLKKITEKVGSTNKVDTNNRYKDYSSHKNPDQNSSQRKLPNLSLLSTGGTISSKIDYRTGGVRAALTAKELNDSIPELIDIANIDPEVVLSEYSENIKPENW